MSSLFLKPLSFRSLFSSHFLPFSSSQFSPSFFSTSFLQHSSSLLSLSPLSLFPSFQLCYLSQSKKLQKIEDKTKEEDKTKKEDKTKEEKRKEKEKSSLSFQESESNKTFEQILQENPSWYKDSENFWEKKLPKDLQMMGGFELNEIDLKTSHQFLQKLFLPISKEKREKGTTTRKKRKKEKRKRREEREEREEGEEEREDGVPNGLVAVDCGAGIGRITFNLLLQYFGKVFLVEQNRLFLEKAKERKDFFGFCDLRCRFVCSSLQDVRFEGLVDLVWVQWVTGYLTDPDFEKFLLHAKSRLTKNGWIIVKDNISDSSSSSFVFDPEDKSIARSQTHFLALFEKCGLRVHRTEVFHEFPQSLLPICIFLLK